MDRAAVEEAVALEVVDLTMVVVVAAAAMAVAVVMVRGLQFLIQV